MGPGSSAQSEVQVSYRGTVGSGSSGPDLEERTSSKVSHVGGGGRRETVTTASSSTSDHTQGSALAHSSGGHHRGGLRASIQLSNDEGASALARQGTGNTLQRIGTMQFGAAALMHFPEQPSAPAPSRPKKVIVFACMQAILADKLFSLVMTGLTVFVLVGDDIRLSSFGRTADPSFDIVTVICLFLFTVEIVLSSLAKEDYFFGFWFMADVFASASLLFDLTPVSNAMLGPDEITVASATTQSNSGNNLQEAQYARASRSSRVGTRIARLLRVVRLVRLSRIMRFFQMFLRVRRRLQGQEEQLVLPGEGADVRDTTESRVGRKLSERTTQRVILLVLAMLVVVPQLSSGDSGTMLLDSAQLGADMILEAWLEMERLANTPNSSDAVVRQAHRDWEMQVLNYVYYHNWHASCPSTIPGDCANEWNYRLCWIGFVEKPGLPNPRSVPMARDAFIQEVNRTMTSWDQLFSGGVDDGGASMKYMVGRLPDQIKGALSRQWDLDCTEAASPMLGVSLVPGMTCPRRVLRSQETMWYMPTIELESPVFFDTHDSQFVFIFDVRQAIYWDAVLGIFQTGFVVLVLAVGALLFNRDVDMLVLQPIERMISKVEIIRQNPLVAIRLGDLQYTEEKVGRSSIGSTRSPQPAASRKGKGKVKPKPSFKKATLETKILENAIIKLGSLLALGFGEAGSEIIGQNLDDDHSTVNVMIPGARVEAIYGFCHVRQFATVTDVLQEKTMVFVNQVAAIVHRIVDEHLGAANKNAGEAFLLVWRIGNYAAELRPKIADLAVMSFVQVVAELSRDRQLAQYREHPALLARLPDFRVSLGFGLHLGWSIEGAIGSEFKIDASYLSPHVNVASRLEAATFEYGVVILMSEPLVRCCNAAFSRHFRPVDRVKVQGSNTATRVFTVDLNWELIPVESAIRERRRKSATNRFQERLEREQRKQRVLEDMYQVHQLFDTDRYIRRMRDRYKVEFLQEFEKGYLNYEAGEWDVAEMVLKRASGMLRTVRAAGDGPSRTLLAYMQGFGFKAPSTWPGWRELRDR